MGRGLSELQKAVLALGRPKCAARGHGTLTVRVPYRHDGDEAKLRTACDAAGIPFASDGGFYAITFRHGRGSRVPGAILYRPATEQRWAESLMGQLTAAGMDVRLSWEAPPDPKKSIPWMPTPDVTQREVLATLYGFTSPPAGGWRVGQRPRVRDTAKAHAARQAVSRAFLRLYARRLAWPVDYSGGACLTPVGLEEAERLSVDQGDNITSVNH
jgi:hypothetical protein